MRSIRTSVRDFMFGIARRWWSFLPAGVGGLFGFYDYFIRPNLPPALRFEVAVPLDVTLWLTGGGILWAAFLTYHELRLQLLAVNGKTDDRIVRQAARDAIGRVIEAGNELRDAMNSINAMSLEADWTSRLDTWYAAAQTVLGEHEVTGHLLSGFQANRTYQRTHIQGKPAWVPVVFQILEDRIARLVEIQKSL